MIVKRDNLLRLGIGALVFAPVPLLAGTSSQCAGVEATGGSCSGSALSGRVDDVINTLFYVAGAIAVIILIIGGIRYITSTGDQARIKTSKDTILYAVIGIIVVILARAIVEYVVTQVAK